MNAFLKTMIAAGISASFGLNALAADTPPTVPIKEHMERMKTMTPEQRAVEREAMRKEMDSLTPEQRAERRKQMHEHWQQMSPEERKKMRKEMKEHRMKIPPEERAEHRKEMRERFDKMSPEERRDFKRGMDGMGGKCDMPPEDCPYNQTEKN